MIIGIIRRWRGSGGSHAKVGDWVLAGEPVGAMPGAVPDTASLRSGAAARQLEESDAGGLLYYELRRDGSPVDPQPWLASVGNGPDEQNRGRKVKWNEAGRADRGGCRGGLVVTLGQGAGGRARGRRSRTRRTPTSSSICSATSSSWSAPNMSTRSATTRWSSARSTAC